MLFLILQNAALLVFAGIGAYAIFSRVDLKKDLRRRQIAMGLLMGLMVVLVTADAFIVEGLIVPLDAKTGLLVYAGYLGGPVGGAIAAAFGTLVRISVGGPTVWVGVPMYLLLGLFGALVARVAPSPEWPRIPRKAIVWLLVGGLIIQLLLIPFAILVSNAGSAMSFVTTGVALALAGVLSTAIMSVVLHYAQVAASALQTSADNALRVRLATKVGNLGMFHRDFDSETVFIDDGMAAILGLPAGSTSIALSDQLQMIVPDDRAGVDAAIDQVWQGTPPVEPTAFRIVRPDGNIRSVQVTWSTEDDQEGPVQHVVGIYVDVTTSQEMEFEKAQVETRLANIIQNLPGAVISFEVLQTGEMNMKFISSYAEQIWGVPTHEILAEPEMLERLHDQNDLSDMMAAFRYTVQALRPVSRRFSITTRDGETKWLDFHASATRFENGNAQIDSIFLDVTAEVIAQKHLETQISVAHQAQKHESIGQLTGGMAHDFNNLLAVIMGNLELLRDEINDEDHRSLIDAGIAASLRGADLTRAMLAFARKATLEATVVDLNKLVRDTKNWTGRTLPASIEVETSLLAGLWEIVVDPSSTQSALLNLILNARDAMDGSGKLTIETANVRIDEEYIDTRQVELKPGRYVMLAVSDTGHGIPPEQVEEIFEPFFSTKGPGKGSGLGLSMIQGFMRQSGGTIQVYSEVGVGTTFKLYFSAAENSAVPVAVRTPDNATVSQKARILVAEDQEEVLQVVVRSLENAGYGVTSAKSGDEAKALFEADPSYDLLLTDIVMPGSLLGTVLAKKLREIEPSLPVVFMSGYASEAAVHGNGLRPDDIRLMKPVQRHDLLVAIAKSLKG